MITLKLTGEPDKYDDYHVQLKLPDGRKITVLIPVGDTYTWAIQDGLTYGLNLVTEGHYS